MAESKKVVIKINLDKPTRELSNKPPAPVTVWHKKRIAVALSLVIVLLTGSIYGLKNYLENDSHEGSENSAPVSLPAGDAGKRNATIGAVAETPAKSNHGIETAANAGQNKTESVSSEAKREFAIIFDKVVIRASLNSALKDNAPSVLVTNPVKVGENQTKELFYFTELKGIKHKIFFHNWLKEGKLVYKKKLEVSRKQLKVSSAKLLTYKDKGNWQIQLVDKTGKVFSEVNFVIESE